MTGGGPRSPDVRVVAALADPRRAVLVAPWWAFAADPTTALLALASHARQRSHLPATAPSRDHDRVCAALPKVRIWCTRADRYPSMLPAMWPRGCRRWRGASSSSWTGWTRPDVTTPNALPSWRSTSVCARPPDHQDRFEVGPWSENLADGYVALGRVDDAVRTIRNATESGYSEGAEMLCELAEKLMRAGHEPQARPLWKQARASLPDDMWGVCPGRYRVLRHRRSRHRLILADPRAGAGAAHR